MWRAEESGPGFAWNDSGSISVEAVIILPLLIWAFVATYVYFDAFETKNVSHRAAYTLSDLLSRQQEEIDMDFLDGLHSMYDTMVTSSEPTWIRVTVVTWDSASENFRVEWSHGTGEVEGWTTASLDAVQEFIPAMSSGDTNIIVETSMTYSPPFNVGIGDQIHRSFVVTSPRFTPQLCWVDSCSS